MSGTISTVLTNTYTLSVDPTTITKTGGVEIVTGYAAVTGPSPTAWTVHNKGIVSDAGSADKSGGYGVLLEAGGTITNSTGASITGGVGGIEQYGYVQYFGAGVGIRGASGTVVNAGTIVDESTNFYGGHYEGVGVTLAAGGTVTNMNGGVIAGDVAGILSAGPSVTVINRKGGTITADFSDVNLETGTVINAGLMTGTMSAGTVVGEGGVSLGSGEVHNETGGVITGGVEIGTTGTVVNAGSITERYIAETPAHTGQGTYNVIYSYGGTGVTLSHGGRVTNGAGGLIVGGTTTFNGILAGGTGVVISGGPGTVVNAGTITGGTDAVALATGFANRVVYKPGAVFNGTVDGGNAIGGPVASTLELATGGSTSSDNVLWNPNVSFVDFSDITVDKGADWQLSGGYILAGQTISDAGTLYWTAVNNLPGEIALRGGTLETDGITVAPGGVIAGSGTVVAGPQGGGVAVSAGATLDAVGTLTFAGEDGGVGISGAVNGNEISIEGGGIDFEKGVHGSIRTIAVSGGTAYLDSGLGSLAFHGALDISEGTIDDLDESNVTLTGPVSIVGSVVPTEISGTGRLTLGGTSQLAGVSVEASELLINAGSLTQSGSVTIGGVALGSTASLRNATAGTWDITTDTGIGTESKPIGNVTNLGTFEKTGGTGTSVISADFVNYGTIIAESGTLDFTGGFANYGHIIDNGGTVIIGPASPALFNQHVAGAAPASSASIVAAAPPETKNTPLLATPHAA